MSLRTALLAIPCVVLAGCGDAPSLAGTNALLIVVDTLGAKHLGAYGTSPSPSPHLDRLAGGGVRFDNAFTSAPWTQPSVASLLTGRMPSRHGVTNLLDSLPAEEHTLGEAFEAAGYRTRAVVSHFLIGSEFGYDQGFSDGFDASSVAGHDGITSARVTDRAIEALEELQGDPFFLFVHYFDPHYLYHHHEAFDRTSSYGGNLLPSMPISQLRDAREHLTPLDVDYLVGLYREEIAFTDAQVGRLLDALEERGLTDRTLVVVTADHGEEFMEHGWIGHTRNLYDDLLRVPLLVSLPGTLEPAVVSEPVTLVDVLPTLAELLDLPAGPHALEGRSLAATLRSGAAPPERALFAEVSFDPPIGDPSRVAEKRADQAAIVQGDLKLVHDLARDTWHLFDRGADPGESEDLAGRGGPELEALRARLEAWEKGRASSRAAGNAPGQDDIDRLRALGYIR